MMFVVRDALKFLGLFPDKNTKKEISDAWKLKIEEYKQELFTKLSKEIS